MRVRQTCHQSTAITSMKHVKINPVFYTVNVLIKCQKILSKIRKKFIWLDRWTWFKELITNSIFNDEILTTVS